VILAVLRLKEQWLLNSKKVRLNPDMENQLKQKGVVFRLILSDP
jgi:hypothetical protein